jgi:hypothetical protein
LVVLRIGCVVDAAKTPWGRKDIDGNQVYGNAADNNTVVTEYHEDRVFE